jgi:tetratricopeptide (TPR) repeat protein
MLKSSKEICEEIMNLLKVCDYDNARTLIENFLKVEENNVEILDLYAEVLVNLELPDQAKIVLEKSIQIAPNSNGDKYMSLAELSEYKLALKLYLKGIEVYNQSINQKNENEKEFKISIANGYAAIAELYMNSPLWYK